MSRRPKGKRKALDPEIRVEPAKNDKKKPDKAAPVRRRGENLVAEARIAKGGGGIPGISSYYQALVYLVVLAALTGAIWWAFSQAN
jgi:hypothetical protein